MATNEIREYTLPPGSLLVDRARLSDENVEDEARRERDDPSAKSLFMVKLEDRMEPVIDVLGGTRGMRAAGERYVAAEKGEHEKIPDLQTGETFYQRRINRGVMFGALPQAMNRVCDRMFATPPSIGSEGDERKEDRGLGGFPLGRLVEDADRDGTHIDDFAKALVADASKWGMTHVLVDMPVFEATDLRTAEALDIRPYFNHISGGTLFAVKHRRLRGGRRVVAQIRWRSDVTGNAEGELYREQNQERITAWNFRYSAAEEEGAEQPSSPLERPGTFVHWTRESSGDRWEPGEVQEHGIEGYNLQTLFFRKGTGPFEALPPFEDLARTMTRWWASHVEQNNNLHFARYETRILFADGDDELQRQFSQVGNTSQVVKDPAGHAERLGAPTSGIEAGWVDLQRLENQAVSEGLAPFVQASGPSKATDSVLGENRSMSEAQTWANALGMMLKRCFETAARIASSPSRAVRLPEAFRVKIHDEALVLIGNSAAPQMVLDAAREGFVHQRGLIAEFQRYGILSREIDTDAALREGAPSAVLQMGSPPNRAGQPQNITREEGGPQTGRNAASAG